MAQHKVHFFRIAAHDHNFAARPHIFEEVCQEIFELPVEDKSLEISNEDSYRLNYFQKVSDHYEGKVVRYRTNHMITGSLSDDQLSDFTLANGQKFTEVTHFIYTPETRILSFEYNHRGPRYAQFMRYLNTVQQRYKTDGYQFEAEVLLHPNVVQKLSEARRIKSLTLGLPVSKIPNKFEKNNLLAGLAAGAQLGNPGQIELRLIGARKRGDTTPLISAEGLMNAIESGQVDLGLFGKANVEIVTDFAAETVNLLENKLEAFKDWNVPITSQNAHRWFADIKELYQRNKSQLLIAMGRLENEQS
ncbi:MAG TPA: hypothetical protein VD907_00140 [Verrucomicrobiae bacterium]|nr:hypothetical protein [Verrucomicrobiae bacterium]